jgi:cyclohexane-1-carbonyl-CoA dehydrogenase
MTRISEEQKIMMNNLRRAVKEKVAPFAAENDRTGRFNPEIASLFWDLGLLEIMLPEEYGVFLFYRGAQFTRH